MSIAIRMEDDRLPKTRLAWDASDGQGVQGAARGLLDVPPRGRLRSFRHGGREGGGEVKRMCPRAGGGMVWQDRGRAGTVHEEVARGEGSSACGTPPRESGGGGRGGRGR